MGDGTAQIRCQQHVGLTEEVASTFIRFLKAANGTGSGFREFGFYKGKLGYLFLIETVMAQRVLGLVDSIGWRRSAIAVEVKLHETICIRLYHHL